TSEVYGDPLIHPQPESYWGNVNPIGPRACYDEGKRAAETLFFSYRQQFNMPIKVIRIFNTYGPRMRPDDGRVVSNFIFNAIKGKNLVIYGDGTQTRSFCYVDDLIEGMVRMIQTPNDVTGPVNLGNPGEFTIRELAEKILSMTRSGSKIEYRPAMQDDPQQRQPDITLAKSLLGWQPTVPLEEGLRRTIRFFQSQIENSAM
ncbi:MAG: GDP-mannose 4,6-dehydratase, partial [Bacteroidales bacterium]